MAESPSRGRVVSVSKSKTSVFEKLNALADEISEGIRSISDQPKTVVNEEIMQMKNLSYRERLPEVEFATLLYRKYADLTSSIASGSKAAPATYTAGVPSSASSEFAGIELTHIPVPIPTKMIDLIEVTDEDELVGWPAIRSSIFKLRGVATVLSFLAWAIITSTPGITKSYLKADSLLTSTCPFKGTLDGGYHMGAFQAAQAAAILIFIHSFVYAGYYVMPIDESTGFKYIPGFQGLAEKIMSPDRFDAIWKMIMSYFVMYRKLGEFVMDAFLVVYTALVMLIASIMIDRSAQMGVIDGTPTYFTLGTFYDSFR